MAGRVATRHGLPGDELAELAQSNGADEGLVEAIRSSGGKFDGRDGVMKGMKGDLGD